MDRYLPWSYTSRILENKVKIEPFVNNCLELWLFHHIIYSTLSSYRYEYISQTSFSTPSGGFPIAIAADWLSECWGNAPSLSSALLADRNRWDNPPFLLRNLVKKWLCTCACLCAASTCWLECDVCLHMCLFKWVRRVWVDVVVLLMRGCLINL